MQNSVRAWVLTATLVLPAGATAQFICHTDIGIAVTPPGAMAVGDTKTVTLVLGTGVVEGGSKVTINRLRYELDCEAQLGLGVPCPDPGDIFTYLGDSTIMTDCPGTWSSNAPAGGNVPNEIIFTPSSPFDILPSVNSFCSLSFGVARDGADTASSADGVPVLSFVVAGFSAQAADALCDNGLASLGAEAAAIELSRPPRARQSFRQRVLSATRRRHY